MIFVTKQKNIINACYTERFFSFAKLKKRIWTEYDDRNNNKTHQQ